MAAAEPADIALRLEATAIDSTLDPAERIRELKKQRRGLTTLLGTCDSYISSLELQREARAHVRVLDRAEIRELADIREALRAEGVSDAELDQAGLPSAAELEQAESDGTLQEVGFGLALNPALARKIALKRRRKKGRFADEFGSMAKPKGRGGAALPTAKPPPVRAPAPEPPPVPKPSAPETPEVEKPERPDRFGARREQLQKRVTKAAKRGVTERAPQAPGTASRETAPTPDPHAERPHGHASQKEFLAYARRAVSQPTTTDAYAVRDPETGRRTYDNSRRALHERIIQKLLGDLPSQEDPSVFFTGGGYAAGKGGVVDSHPNVPPDALVLDPDAIKAMLPEFQAALETDPEANLLVYEEAWDISQELQRRAMERKVNMVVDGISDTSKEDMLGRVKLFKDAGYTDAKLVVVTIPTEEAITRSNKRALKAKKPSDRRFIPEVIMRSVHRDVSATLPGVIEGAKDLGLSVEVWDNNQGWNEDTQTPVPPVKLFHLDEGGEPQILDDKLWDEFLAKGKEAIPGVDAEELSQLPDEDREQLLKRWAGLDRELLAYVGQPEHPEARRIITEQKQVMAEVHRQHKGVPQAPGTTARDVVVVGAGPAGLSAAIYGGTEGLNVLLVDASTEAGGQAGLSSRIENVLGHEAGIGGRQYVNKGIEQAQRVGAETAFGVRVERLEYDEPTGVKTVHLSDGSTVTARAVIIAGGVQFRELDIPGMDAAGVVYGDSWACKAATGENDHVVVVGGANSAGQAALDVASAGRKVTVLIRKGDISDKMSEYLVNQIEGDPNITVQKGEIGEIVKSDNGGVSSVKLKDGNELPAKSVGFFIGSAPEADWTGVERDDDGYVAVGKKGRAGLETSIPGVYAAGDVRAGSVHRVITAAADGAHAVALVHGYVASQGERDEADAEFAPDETPQIAALDAYLGAGGDDEEVIAMLKRAKIVDTDR